MSDSENETSSASEPRTPRDEARREALAKMGRLAGYTAPVMLTLLGTTKARAGPLPFSIKPK